MKLMVLDGNSLVNRAFFGIKLLTTKDGRYTNAIYGFQNILLNLLAAHKPDAVAIAWDERAPTFRHNAYDGYKATRHGMPEELAQQMPVLKELLTDLGFVQVSKAGWEADDILGTLAAACEAAGGTTLLATGDRDSLQLVDDATTVLLATNKETIPMDPAAIREKYGIEPPQLIDVKSLMGDASDNIPGVPGIGEKTALALISKFGSLQGVYDNIEDKAVKPGQRVAIVGPTGCGKTTFINLLMRFYDPDGGEILLDGVNTQKMNRGELRRSVGMVLQDTWLKAGTIRENIAMGKPEATEEEIIAAAKQAHAHSFIMRLPQGYDTVIGESGGSLSQGQKQLLCIARVMLCLPPMLFLDEATSSIDTRTEIKIQKAFDTMMRGRTSFIVAHRLSTIREADRILVMRDGHIVEQGKHEELLAKDGFYARLYQSQFAH